MLSMVEEGLGLTYAFEPGVQEQLRDGRLVRVLEPHAPTVPGFLPLLPEPRAALRAATALGFRFANHGVLLPSTSSRSVPSTAGH
jgi:DNA-binding transcriptional LysR family regulator